MNCENCNKEHNGDYGSGRFCEMKCAKMFSTKQKRLEINKKVSNTLNKKIYKVCPICGLYFTTVPSKNGVFCGSSCSAKNRWLDKSYNDKMSKMSKERCNNIEERNRLRLIGRKGGFGKKGYTINGTYYESTLEKNCFEYLENKNIKFIAHKPIPNSSKISDIFLLDKNLWIELDGIDREKRKKWLGENYDYWLEKLSIYKRENLKFFIVKNLNELIQKINN